MLLRCLALVLLEFAGHAVARMWVPPLSSWRLPYQHGPSETTYLSGMHTCKKQWRDGTLDHFSWASSVVSPSQILTWQQITVHPFAGPTP